MNQPPAANASWTLARDGGTPALRPRGEWSVARAEKIFPTIERAREERAPKLVIEGGELTFLDTNGAALLLRLALKICADREAFSLSGFRPEHESLLRLVEERAILEPPAHPKRLGVLARIGKVVYELGYNIFHHVAFLGATFAELGWTFLHPRTLRLRELFVQLERVCVDALGIVALVMALIGIVVSYLFAMQLIKYGANAFLVDGVVLAVTRELSPIVVAILMAGRSGSAFTAQIGTMKINEEIDALVTMGLSPMRVLVLPRTLALIIALPLLTFFGDLVGVAGGMLVANGYADISGYTFMNRVFTHYPIESFYIGLGKAPVFALFIATIGCRMGLTVANNAQSVGEHTTSTVVQSIVVIIILNAAFAVLFADIGFYKT